MLEYEAKDTNSLSPSETIRGRDSQLLGWKDHNGLTPLMECVKWLSSDFLEWILNKYDLDLHQIYGGYSLVDIAKLWDAQDSVIVLEQRGVTVVSYTQNLYEDLHDSWKLGLPETGYAPPLSESNV